MGSFIRQIGFLSCIMLLSLVCVTTALAKKKKGESAKLGSRVKQASKTVDIPKLSKDDSKKLKNLLKLYKNYKEPEPVKEKPTPKKEYIEGEEQPVEEETPPPPPTRSDYVAQIHEIGLAGTHELRKIVVKQIETLEKEYIKKLAPLIRGHHISKLMQLSDEQIKRIYQIRYHWRFYIWTASGQGDFEKEFLGRAQELEDLLLFKITDALDEDTNKLRDLLIELSSYLDACNDKLNIDTDPTIGKKSPKGILFPYLDKPRSFMENLDYLERTLVLMHTVAWEEAHPLLMENATVARELDYEEGEFVYFGTRTRMLVGSIMWRVDAVNSACARDHSHDRKNGDAKGHSSSLPGKKSFGDRNKRFGCKYSGGEGAGGGRTGKGAIWGLSYGGGHTKPLYAILSNVVGVGRRQGPTTGLYGKQKEIRHPCPVTERELFMVPGLRDKDIKDGSLKGIFKGLKSNKHADNLSKAQKLVEKYEAKFAKDKEADKTPKEKDLYNYMMAKFFSAAIEEELNFCLEELKDVAATGDVYGLKLRVDVAKKRFGKVKFFAEKIKEYESLLKDKKDEIKRGKAYYDACIKEYKTDNIKAFIKKLNTPDSIYHTAAKHVADRDLKGKWTGLHPLTYFVEQVKGINRYGYKAPLESPFYLKMATSN